MPPEELPPLRPSRPSPTKTGLFWLGIIAVAAFTFWLVATSATQKAGEGGWWGFFDPDARVEKEVREAEREKRRQQAEADRQTVILRNTTAKRTQQRALDDCDQALENLDRGIGNAKRWDAEIPPLLDNDAGRYVAADPNLLKKFGGIYDAEGRPTARELERSRGRVDALCDDLRILVKEEENYADVASITAALAAEQAIAKQADARLANDYDELLAIVDAAKAKRGSPSAETLREATRAYHATRSQQDADREARIAAEEERIRLESEEQLRIREAEDTAQREKNALDGRIAAANAEAHDNELNRLANDAGTIADFQPFLATGHCQPWPGKTPKTLGWNGPGWRGAMNLRHMTDAGIFKDLDLFILASTKGCGRPLWTASLTQDRAEMERRWKLFQELTPLWVAQGKLENR